MQHYKNLYVCIRLSIPFSCAHVGDVLVGDIHVGISFGGISIISTDCALR